MTKTEIAEKTAAGSEEEYKEIQRRKSEKSLEEGLEDSFPGLRSDQRDPAASDA